MQLKGFPDAVQLNNVYSTYRQCLEVMGINCTLGCDAPEHLQHLKSGELFFAENNLKPNLPEDPVVFDVGANEGRYAEFILSIFPKAKLHCFEPHPKTFKRLEKKYGDSENVQLYNVALGEEAGDAILYERADHPEGSEMASLHKKVITDFHRTESVEIETKIETVDDIVSREKINKIDFLKIDVEGHELGVIQGAKDIIKRNELKVIQFEFNHPNIESRVFMRDFRDVLKGYEFYRLLENGMIHVLDHVIFQEIFGYQNIVVIKK